MKGKKSKGKANGKSGGASGKQIFSFISKWLKRIVIFFFVSTILVVLLYRFVPVHYTPLMFIRCIEQKLEGKEMKMTSTWVPLSEINQNMINAVVYAEDANFMFHWGFDFEAIQKAAKQNMQHAKVYGASTISQQTAKNVFLWPSRTWIRKGLEAYFTVLIELLWNKERIMEVYLNVVELGDGIYGVDAASVHYYGKPARRLSNSQAALLAASLPNPLNLDPAHPSFSLYKSEKRILKQMMIYGDVDLKHKE
ncbi:MAG: monofunctional biosynthetic peptidoglycan transglycosylase [Paludibacteraceae bacterium]|nr:monofunctional biosynthetic peptidoglycan transglycosylase [Paludibacteraceae bacterium]